MKSTSSPRENTQPLDVLVVGGGNAALCAAITARRAGASVMLLEASPKEFRGGNSRHTRNIRYVHAAKNDFLTGPYTEEECFNDLMGVTKMAFSRSFDFQVYLWAAVLYLLIVEVVRRSLKLIEGRLGRHLQ